MAGEEEDHPSRRFEVIEGLLERPRPREPSWPRRYRVVRVRRSVRRPRTGAYKAEYLEEIGVLLRESRPGSSRRRPRKKWGAPPFRTEQRKARARLLSASQEEIDRLLAEAWAKLMELRDRIRFGSGIDPDGTGGTRYASLPAEGIDPDG